MMSNVKVVLNTKGIGELLRSQWASDVVQEVADGVAMRAGDDYGVRVHDSGQRMIANVYPESKEAYQDNLDNNTLLKALGG